MPVLTTLIDDKSPLIQYDSTWVPGSSLGDPETMYYYLGTFTMNGLNQVTGTVTFSFNGTAVWIYGANRPGHGTYVVQLDDQAFTFNGSTSVDLFRQVIFNASSLIQGTHTIKLTNTGSGYNVAVDIDMIRWQSEINNTADQLVVEIVQDTDARWQYQEPAWNTVSATGLINLNLFNNGSGHITETSEASVTFTFEVRFFSFERVTSAHVPYKAEAVSIFGSAGPANGPYLVQLDGGQNMQYNASLGSIYPQNYGVVIYHADNLGSGIHQVVLTNLPDAAGQFLAVDYAKLYTAQVNPVTASNNTLPNSTNSGNPSNTLNLGVIIGIAVAGAVALLGVGAAVFFYRRWKAAQKAQSNFSHVYTPRPGLTRPTVVAPPSLSSSRETRESGAVLLANTLTRRAQQQANDSATQSDTAASTSCDFMSPALSLIDETWEGDRH